MKKRITNIWIGLLLFIGIGCLLYPTAANWWNQLHQSYAIASYMKITADEKVDYSTLKEEARVYNEKLIDDTGRWNFTEEEEAEYVKLLSVTEDGILGCIEIPKINVSLPIYHGTEESILQVAVGHMKGSSLPIGGEGTHSVLSGHTGLPSAKLFTDIDQLEIGDIFTVQVLDELLTYEVERIVIVEPKEMEYLEIKEGKDYCTLLTCTPYGINTHRLLVRGERVENEKKIVATIADNMKNSWGIRIVILAVGGSVAVLILRKIIVK